MPKSIPIQSVCRALRLLDLVTARALYGEGITLREAAEHLGVNPTTAHNILRTMVACGYLERGSGRTYVPGPRCRDIARQGRLGGAVLVGARGVVNRLAESTGESVVLAILSQGCRHPLLRAEGGAAVRVSPALESDGSPFRWVTGRVLAAYATPAELRTILQRHGLPGEAWEGIHTEEGLHRALAKVREAGMAEEHSASAGVHAMAVPVLDPHGFLLAALGLFVPAFRASPEHLRRLGDELRAAAAQIAVLA
jgi:DNA-binding IclR family transcriptional regulator